MNDTIVQVTESIGHVFIIGCRIEYLMDKIIPIQMHTHTAALQNQFMSLPDGRTLHLPNLQE